MLEDMLAYGSRTARNRPQPKAMKVDIFDLERDARRFYTRMAMDIGTLADGANRSSEAPVIVRALLEALMAAPAAKAPAWRRLYREVSFLATRYPLASVSENVRADVVPALGRIRQFLSENADIGDALKIEDFARLMQSHPSHGGAAHSVS
jgi:hypothetical protein